MLDLDRLKSEQSKIAKKIIFKDFVKIESINCVAGVDSSYKKINGKEYCVNAIAVLDFKTLSVLEIKSSFSKIEFPYVPNFLSFRELPGFLRTFKKLRLKPEVFLFDANGIIHPRFAGFASHAGVVLKKPTIGIAKNLLCGIMKGVYVYLNDKKIGFVLKRNDFRELFVSPGNMITLKTAVRIVSKCFLSEKQKLPEPIRIAHKISKELLNNF